MKLTQPAIAPDLAEIARAITVITEPGAVFEIRALGVSMSSHGAAGISSGYFNDPTAAAELAARLSRNAAGVYLTLNPVNSALLARANNRVRTMGKGDASTADPEIERRRWFPIDTDPVRPSGISSTEAEHAAALVRRDVIAAYLRDLGWPEPLAGDSANGGHLLYRVDLPREDSGLIKGCLAAVAALFTDSEVTVDAGNHNPARIWKLYGTVGRKGDNLPERPHRLARISQAPERLEPVSRALLEALAGTLEESTTPAAPGDSDDVGDFLARHNLAVHKGPDPYSGGRRWVIDCPWNASHTDNSAYIIQFPSGKVAAGCHHNGCQGKTWGDLYRLFTPKAVSKNGHDRPRAKTATLPPARTVIPTEDDLTDLGNARLLVQHHGEHLRYVRAWGWLTWDGNRWRRDDLGRVMRLAKRLPGHWRDLASTALDRAKTAEHDGRTEEAGDLRDRAETFLRWAKSTSSHGKLTAALSLAESEVEVAATPDAFDSDHFLLNTPSGTLALQSGVLRAHDPATLLTKITGAPYDPKATCPAFTTFMEAIQPDAAIRAYLQRAAGYALCGDGREQVLFFLYGTGQNGKSTFLNALAHAWGDYADTARPETFMVKKHGEGIPNDLAALVGARLVATTETEDGQRLAESLIKRATGQDKLTVRFLHKEHFSYVPTWKLFLAANHKPTVRGQDMAIWRRIPVIPFTITIPETERDRDLPNKLEAEAAGILVWAVAGFADWQRQGLNPPAAISAATKDYRQEMDVLGRFLDECCIGKDEAQAPKGLVFRVYRAWCEANNEYPETSRAFGQRLHERGITDHKRTGGQRCWRGIGLVAHSQIVAQVAQVAENAPNFVRKASLVEKYGQLAPLAPLAPLSNDADDPLLSGEL